MNIFAVDVDPRIAAQSLCDQHVVKMTLETAQLLCTTCHHFGIDAEYKETHKNHPCTLWARESWANLEWLIAHGDELGNEYTQRFGKFHKSHAVIKKCRTVLTRELGNLSGVMRSEMTPFALAMPEKYKTSTPVQSYRDYYRAEKIEFKHGPARWTSREEPSWLVSAENDKKPRTDG